MDSGFDELNIGSGSGIHGPGPTENLKPRTRPGPKKLSISRANLDRAVRESLLRIMLDQLKSVFGMIPVLIRV